MQKVTQREAYHAKLTCVEDLIELHISRMLRSSNKLIGLRQQERRLTKAIAKLDEQAKVEREAKRKPRVPNPKVTEPPIKPEAEIAAAASTAEAVTAADIRANREARMKAAGFRKASRGRLAQPASAV